MSKPTAYLDFTKAISERVYKLRLERKLNQTELAQALGISQPTVSKIENGTAELSAVQLYQLCRFMKIPVGRFFQLATTRRSERSS